MIRFPPTPTLSLALGSVLSLLAACGSSNGGNTGGNGGHGGHAAGGAAASSAGAGGTGAAPLADAATDGGAATDAGASTDAVSDGVDAALGPTLVRIAHLAPDLPPIDFCVAPHGTGAFQGPLLGQQANPDGGGGGSVSYGQIGAYLPVDPGAYDVRLVSGGATSCSTGQTDAGPDAAAAINAPAVADVTDLGAFLAGAHVTLLVAGVRAPTGGDATLAVKALSDDTSLASAAALRVVNAIPSLPAADFGFGSFAGGWLPLFTDVPFGAAGTKAGPSNGAPDANGYLALAPTSAAQVMSVRASAGATIDVAISHGVEIDFGSVATLFAIGGATGDTAHPAALLLCLDNQPGSGARSVCNVLP